MDNKRQTGIRYSLVCSTSRLFLCLLLIVALSIFSMYCQFAFSGVLVDKNTVLGEQPVKDKEIKEDDSLKRVKRLSAVVNSQSGFKPPALSTAVGSSYNKTTAIKTMSTSYKYVNRSQESERYNEIVDDRRLGTHPTTGSTVLVIILIHSSITERQRRKTIRETWLSPAAMSVPNTSYMYWFVIGGKGASDELRNHLKSEQDQFSDLLILWSVRNDYIDLTSRSLYSMLHVANHYTFSYLLKTDDDVFLNTPIILSELRHLNPRQRVYWGRFSCHNPPMEDGRWKEKEWHWCDVYYPYAYGGMYILSQDVVHLITLNAESLQYYSCEDVSLGVWLAPYNLHRINDGRIFVQHSPKCSRGYIAVHIQHRLSHKLMMKYFDNLKRKGIICSTLCKEEILLWEGLPFQCLNTTKIVV